LNTLDKALREYSSALAILALLTLSIILGACNSSSDDADEVKLVGVLQLIDALDPIVDGLKQGLAESKFVEGQNISYMYRNVKGDTGLLQGYLREMIEADVDLIVSLSDPPTAAAKTATHGTGIPVIFSVVSNPQETGLVGSLSAPGGNMSGTMAGINLAAAKRLETLLRVDPDIERVLIVYSTGKTSFPGIREMRDAAPKLGVDLLTVEVATTEEATAAFTSFAPGEIDAVFMPVDAVVKGADAALQELVKRDHIPIVSPSGIRGDSVMSYGPDLRDLGAQMGVMVAKVLNGADPATLPVELPRRQRLALFLGRAKEIGYQFSDTALSLADVVIRE